MDSSSEDFEDLNCIEEGDLDDISDGATKKPHFLDYDAKPPTGEELQYSCYSSLPESSSRQSLTGLVGNANDLDKNNANEKSAGAATVINVPSARGNGVGEENGDESQPGRILLTRRRSATEVIPTIPGLPNTGTRKKEFSTGGSSSGGYHSLDYDGGASINRSDRRFEKIVHFCFLLFNL